MPKLAYATIEWPRVIVEASRRRGRKRPANTRFQNNNYLAERRSSICRGTENPNRPLARRIGCRRRAGAPRANVNALRTGLYTAAMKARRARHRAVRARLRLARTLIGLILALNRVQRRTLDN